MPPVFRSIRCTGRGQRPPPGRGTTPFLVEVGLDVGEQGVDPFALVGVDHQTGALVHQQDVLVLVHDAHARCFDAAEGFLLLGRVKIFVIEVKLHGIALGELVGSFSALVIDLDCGFNRRYLCIMPPDKSGTRFL